MATRIPPALARTLSACSCAARFFAASPRCLAHARLRAASSGEGWVGTTAGVRFRPRLSLKVPFHRGLRASSAASPPSAGPPPFMEARIEGRTPPSMLNALRGCSSRGTMTPPSMLGPRRMGRVCRVDSTALSVSAAPAGLIAEELSQGGGPSEEPVSAIFFYSIHGNDGARTGPRIGKTSYVRRPTLSMIAKLTKDDGASYVLAAVSSSALALRTRAPSHNPPSPPPRPSGQMEGGTEARHKQRDAPPRHRLPHASGMQSSCCPRPDVSPDRRHLFASLFGAQKRDSTMSSRCRHPAPSQRPFEVDASAMQPDVPIAAHAS